MPSAANVPERAQVIGRVAQALAQAVARLEEREKALSQQTYARQTSIHLDFAKFERQLVNLANCPKPAGKQLAEIEISLRDGEEALRQWLVRAETTRRKLAAGEGRAVG